MRFRFPVQRLTRLSAVCAAAWIAACGSTTEPLPVTGPLPVRIEPVTPIHVTTTAGAEVTPAPAVRAIDGEGRPVAGVPVTFKLGQSAGVLARPGSTTDTNGVATVQTWTLGPTVGSQSLIARSTGLADVVFTAITRVGPAARITRVSGNDQIAPVRGTLAQPLVVRVGDAFGNPVARALVIFRVTGGSGTVVAGFTVTDSGGQARSGPWVLGPETGVQQVRVETGAAQAVFSAFGFAPLPGLSGRLAFVSIGDGDAEIHAVNADGSAFKRLTTHIGLDQAPAWSADGSRIAFARHHEGRASLYVMSADGSNLTRLADGVLRADEVAWSPGGADIAFTALSNGSVTLFTVRNPDGALSYLGPGGSGFATQPSWSPDGRQLAFVGDPSGGDYLSDIYTMNADGSGVTRRTQGFGSGPDVHLYFHPAWSPDGSRIAFVYGSIINNEDMRFRVAIMSAEGVFLRDLAWAGDIPFRGALSPGSLAWSPDGGGIAYSFYDCDLVTHLSCSKVSSVNYVSLDGSQQGRMITNAQNPSWRSGS